MTRWIALKGALFSRLVLFLAALGGSICYFYWPTLAELVQRWSRDSHYSHGFLVPVFSLILLWQRRAYFAKIEAGIYASGLILLLVAAILRCAAGYLYFDWLDAISLLPCLAGVAALYGGRAGLRWSWPAIVFLVFMVPLPFRAEMALGAPLQRIATYCSTYALQTLGFPALAEGNTILLDDVRMGVVEACNGLGMLVTFFALSLAVAFLIQRPLWEKMLVVVSAVPIAILTNVVRITVTGVLHQTVGHWLADLVFHDLAGWLMPPFAIGLLWIELKLLSRLLVKPVAPVDSIPKHPFGKAVSAYSVPAAKTSNGAHASAEKVKKNVSVPKPGKV